MALTIKQLERLSDLLEMWGRDRQSANNRLVFDPMSAEIGKIRRAVEGEIEIRRRATGHVNRRNPTFGAEVR